MDPLSAIASVIEVYKLASEVGKLCFNYAQGVRYANRDSDLIIDEISRFQRSLQNLKGMLGDEDETTAKGGTSRLKNLKEIVDNESGTLNDSKKEFEKLLAKLEYGKTKEGIHAIIRQLTWPLHEDDVKRVVKVLRSVTDAIEKALSIDTVEMVRGIDTTTKRIEETLHSSEEKRKEEENRRKEEEELKKAEETRKSIFEWLSHPNPTENHNIACAARNDTAKTGRWFLDGSVFQEFKDTPRSLLWLHGDSGCGKTILSSAIIDELKALQIGDGHIEVAFWYFNVNDKTRTSLDNLMRSLITQLVPDTSLPPALLEFWKAKKNGKETPKTSDLVVTLQKMLLEKVQRKCFIVVDALDESNDTERDDLLEMLQTLVSGETVDLHVLVTSRTNTTGIEEGLKNLTKFYNIAIEREHINADILAHIQERLQNDKVLKLWPLAERKKIEESLVEKAAGMFRWVDCQLQAIRKCKKPADLRATLNKLPKDVHEQYARELAHIPEESSKDALKLLQWLTFPQRKIRIEEANDMLAVDLDSEPPVFDIDSKMYSPELVLEVCGSLIRTDINPDGRNSLGEVAEVQTLTTAHATVSDFLKSQPVKIGPEPETRFTRSAVNLRMAETCLVYLRYFLDNSIELSESNLSEFPFARMSAEFWDDHYREIVANPQEKVDITRLNGMIMDLFKSEEAKLIWVRLCNPDDDTARVDFDKQVSDLKPPIYYAALLGLPDIVREFVKDGADINWQQPDGYGTPLVAASALGRTEVVSILLDSGADATLSGYYWWGCPLAAAVEADQADVVDMLLKREGVDINCLRALPKPSAPTESVTEVESEAGGVKPAEESQDAKDGAADDSSKAKTSEETTDGDAKKEEGEEDTEDDTAVDTEESEDEEKETEEPASTSNSEDELSPESMCYIAAAYNSPAVMKVLLKAGADPNILGGRYGTALQAASVWGREDMVEALLEHGAKVDIYGGFYEHALQAACFGAFLPIVKRLIAAGADVNHIGGDTNCALYAASLQEKPEIVELLLDHGAKTDIYGGPYEFALQAAAYNGNVEVAKLLIKAGSDVNHKGGICGSPLYGAANGQKADMVELLLEHGADPNLRECGPCDHALQTACELGDPKIVKLLLDKGADPNIKAGYWGSSLQAACYFGNEETIQLLLDKGADPTIEGGYFGTVMQAAVMKGNENVVKKLLELNVSPNVKGGSCTYPLLRACASGADHEGIVRLLLEHGADPNLEREGSEVADGKYKTALHHTSSDHVAHMLLDHGAKVNTVSGYFGSALHWTCAAAVTGLESMIETLLHRGADLNIHQELRGTPLHSACEAGNIEYAKILLKHGALCDETDLIGRTPFMVTMHRGGFSSGMAEILLEKDTNVLRKDKRGCTALHYAACSPSIVWLQKLIELGGDVNDTDSAGWTPLHWAAACGPGSAKAIKLLLKSGAKKDLKSKQDQTPADLAESFGKEEEAAILKAEGEEYEKLPEENDGKKRERELTYACDGCADTRGSQFHCTSCVDFDFCFRCMMDKDIIHPAGHEFEEKPEKEAKEGGRYAA